jgi:hypothetical protein
MNYATKSEIWFAAYLAAISAGYATSGELPADLADAALEAFSKRWPDVAKGMGD